jgi:hypothetical protein
VNEKEGANLTKRTVFEKQNLLETKIGTVNLEQCLLLAFFLVILSSHGRMTYFVIMFQ